MTSAQYDASESITSHRLGMGYGTGRIGEIIDHLQKTYKKPIAELSPRVKLDSLCESIQMDPLVFDAMICDNSPVLRTVKGHAFESFFDYLLTSNGVGVTEVGGDDSVDRIVNERTLQLKTCT